MIEELGAGGLSESSERCSATPLAEIRMTEGGASISYSEQSEGGEIFSEVSLSSECIKVKRTGAIESEFIFSEGETTRSVYRMPPYAFDAEITTKKIRNELSPDGGAISILYYMKIGGAEKRVRMKIIV